MDPADLRTLISMLCWDAGIGQQAIRVSGGQTTWTEFALPWLVGCPSCAAAFLGGAWSGEREADNCH